MRAALGVVALILLAGCAGNGAAKDPVKDADFSNLDLQPTQSTGIIRGVVVDDAIRPLAGVLVSVNGGNLTQSVNTTANGLFGFDRLAPGTYFVRSHKAGYKDAQSSVDVVAGVAAPPTVKVLLVTDPNTRPYFEGYTFDGFLECGATTPVVSIALCLAPNLVVPNTTTDKTQVTYPITNHPAWMQTEMVWQSTQAAGEELAVMYSYTAGCGLYCDFQANGTSPLLLQANQTMTDTILNGSSGGLYVRVFNDDIEATSPPVHPCAPVKDPVLGATWCLANGVGLTTEQKFTHFTHIFYGYSPPAEWRFTSGDPPPAPPS